MGGAQIPWDLFWYRDDRVVCKWGCCPFSAGNLHPVLPAFPTAVGGLLMGPVLSSSRALTRVFCRCFFGWRAFPFLSLLRFLSEDTRVVWPSGLQCWFGTQSLWRQGFTSHRCQGARLPGGPCFYNALTTTRNSGTFLSDAHVGFYGMFSHLLRRHCSRY